MSKSSTNNIYLNQLKIITGHEKIIHSIGIFPSKNIITVSGDQDIKIWEKKNKNIELIQIIKNAHNDEIIYVSIKDENNFCTCSKDKSIKTYIKRNNSFLNNFFIKNAHKDWINKVIFCKNGNIISCSDDHTVKIWEKNPYKNTYQIKLILINYNIMSSILILEDKNYFLTLGFEGTKIYNLNNFNLIDNIKDAKCYNINAVCRINKERIILGSIDENIIIISLIKKKIIFKFNNKIICCGICFLENKNIFLISEPTYIKGYSSDNYQLIFNYEDKENFTNFGLVFYSDNIFISFSYRKFILYSCNENKDNNK